MAPQHKQIISSEHAKDLSSDMNSSGEFFHLEFVNLLGDSAVYLHQNLFFPADPTSSIKRGESYMPD